MGFYVDNHKVGLVRPEFMEKFKKFPEVFDIIEKPSGSGDAGKPAGLHVSASLATPEARTEAVRGVLEKMRDQFQEELVTLRGWYDEVGGL